MKTNQILPCVNFHLWEPCNMQCKFCFATFHDVKQTILPKGHLPKEQAIRIVQELARAGFEKITFAGGEPTLSPWLHELIKSAKLAGMTTMIVTNGSKLNDAFLQQSKTYLDWIAISIDSLNPETNLEMGRAIAGIIPLTIDYYMSVIDKIKQYGYGLKINTVVNQANYNEDMNEFIRFAKPQRWKILQALKIVGQNANTIGNLEITETEFMYFINQHKNLSDSTSIISESNSQIIGSYTMVDPAGRFFDDVAGRHNYSKPILEVGVFEALKEVSYDFKKFALRGGIYDWVKAN